MNVLGYHLFDGRKWLSWNGEWTDDFHHAGCFYDIKEAQHTGDHAAGETRTVYVIACLEISHPYRRNRQIV